MPKPVRLPTGQVLVFPDEATEAQIDEEVNRVFLESRPQIPAGREAPVPTAGEVTQEFIESGAPVAGAMVGGTAGAALTKTPVGAAKGAGLGAAAGQQFAEITRPFLTGEESGLAESAGRTATAGALGALGEGFGQAAMKVVGRLIAPFRKKLSPEGLKAQAAVEKAGVSGALTPAQLTESRALDIGESITEASLLGAGRIKAMREKLATEGMPALVEEFLRTQGAKLTPTQSGQLLGQSRAAAVEAFKGVQRALYEDVDRLAKGVVVNTKPVADFVRKATAEQSRTVERALGAAGVSADDLTIEIAGQAGRSPETTFRIAQEIRSKLLGVARKKPLSVDDQAISNAAGKLAGLMDDQMEAAASKMAPAALQAFRAANAVTKEGIDRLENELIRGLAKRLEKQPSTIVPVLAAPNKADVLRKVKAAVDAPTFERFQEAMTTHLVGRAADPTTGIVSGTRLMSLMKGLGDETAQLVFKAKAAVTDLAKTLDVLQRGVASKEGTGRIFIQLSQASAGLELIFHPIETLTGAGKAARGASVAILAGPAVMGRLFTNPVAVRWLTRGFQAGPGTEGFFRAMSQVVALSEGPKAAGKEAVRIGGERLQQVQELLRR